MTMTTKNLKELERANDLALIKFWKSVEQVVALKIVLDASDQAIDLRIAQDEKESAAAEMAKARLAYLQAKVTRKERYERPTA